ncbi:MAG: stage II sporulation protein D [Clostridia bacterium]|nr:stage II sporulation protein D [Clostridia bacterium]
MKIYGILCITVAVILLVAPLASISFSGKDSEGESYTSETVTAEAESDDTVSVFMSADEKTETLDMRDYIIGTVAAEMPASYEVEALKAQALAAVTYTEYLRLQNNGEMPDGAVISDDSSTHQGYMTKEQMQEKWGEAFDTYYNRIADAVDAVINEVIIYENRPVMAAYHAISTGRTESAENMWGSAVDYLVSVESEGDKYSSRFLSEVTISVSELKELLKNNGYKCENDEIKINSTTEAGTVSSVTVCGNEMTGMELRNLLSMRSPSFTVTKDDDTYIFSVKGYGHGVGMSQYGADWYAEQGYSYREIISHYYPGSEITDR